MCRLQGALLVCRSVARQLRCLDRPDCVDDNSPRDRCPYVRGGSIPNAQGCSPRNEQAYGLDVIPFQPDKLRKTLNIGEYRRIRQGNAIEYSSIRYRDF